MGIYLGQLPPAEIARLKAELAETLIANFCYPRFFDHRTQSLQMRPVDRTKRQEVWLYLSSVDFTAWSRVDLMSADFQHQIERLFIQFVQRNRNFFGDQGRRRMFDVRLQINACAMLVTQALRNHLTGQKQSNPPFGSPRAVVSWASPIISGRPEATWEQISASTMTIQQQLQEVRGEQRTPAAPAAGDNREVREGRGDGRAPAQGAASSASSAANPAVGARPSSPAYPSAPASARRPAAAFTAPAAASASPVDQPGKADYDIASLVHQPTTSIPPVSSRPVEPKPAAAFAAPTTANSGSPSAYRSTQSSRVDVSQPVSPVQQSAPPARPSGPLGQPYDTRQASPSARRTEVYTEPATSPFETQTPSASLAAAPAVNRSTNGNGNGNGVRPPTSPLSDTKPSVPVPTPVTSATRRNVPPLSASSPLPTSTSGSRDMMSVGEDDLAIFEQLRHQLVVWLRIEAITAGLEISSQSPTQLLELLRQQARLDETRLQVVSTLLNLANQVIKTGLVSVLDYKQALMFHLMHTRRQ